MSDFLPKGWIEKYDASLKKVYYNLETQQTFQKKEDLDRYINYITTKATHLHAGTEALWKGPKGKGVLTDMLDEEEEGMLGSIYVPKELASMKFQGSKSKETLSKIYEGEEDGEDWSDDYDDNDDEYTPRKKYKRSGKRKEDQNDDDHFHMTTTPKSRQNNFSSSNRNASGRNLGKAN